MPIRAYVPTHQDCVASIHGGVIPKEEWHTRILRDGEELLLKPVLGVTTVLVPLVIGLALGVVTQVITHYLFPPEKPQLREPPNPTYSFEGIRNTIGPGAKVPVVYGRHRVGGQILQASVENQNHQILTSDGSDLDVPTLGTDNHLNLLLGLCEGEIEEVETSTIELNGQLIANFPDVTTDTRPGSSGQSAIPMFTETRNTFADGREITGGGITYTTTQDVEAYQLIIAFNEGLYTVGNRGDQGGNWTRFRFRHRVSPAGAWSDWNVVRAAGESTSILRTAVRREGLSTETYDINLEWVESGGTEATHPAAFYKPFLESVTEVQDGIETYANTALLGIRAVATENIQGAIPNTTVVVKGTKVRAGSFAATPAYSQNPAWCLMDFLTNARYGLGIVDGEINLTAFTTYGDYCDETVDSEARHLLDYVLTADSEEAIQQITGMSRAIIYKLQGEWTPRILQDETPVQLLSWTNCTNTKLTYTRDPDRINVMEARFADEDESWEQSVLTWPDVDNWPAVVRKSTFDALGVTRRTAVVRALQYELNRRTLPKVLLQADCSLEALALVGNDVFRFSHPMPGWGVSGRIQADSTTTVINLDEDVTFEAGESYHLYVRHEDDTVETKDVTNPGASTVKQITLSSALSQTPQALTSTYAFGKSSPTDTAIREFRVSRLERLTDNTVRIQAQEHNASIYTDATASALPVITKLFNPLGPPPAISSLIATEFSRVGQDGRQRTVVNLSWDVAALSSGFAPYGGAIIYRREVEESSAAGVGTLGEVLLGEIQGSQDGSALYVRIATTGAILLEYDDPLVVTSVTYQYRVVPISSRGIPNQTGDATVLVNVTGPTTPGYFAGTVTNLRLKGQAVGQTSWEGRDCHIEWDKLTSPLFTEAFFLKEYIVEVWAASRSYLMRRVTVTTETFSYTQEMNFEDQVQNGFTAPLRSLVFVVRARTNTGRESLTDVIISVSNPAPDMSSLTPVLTPLIDGLLVDWSPFVEPRDLDRYRVLFGTTTPPVTVFSGLSQFQQKALIPDLSSANTYYVRVVPYDTFGIGVASAIASATPQSAASQWQFFVRDFIPDGIDFSPDPVANTISWTAGTLNYIDDNGQAQSASISADSASWGGSSVFVYYVLGDSAFSSTTSIAQALGANKAVMAVYNGGVAMVVLFGKAKVHGSDIIANTIGANQLVVSTAIITVAAQIATAVIATAAIQDAAITSAKVGTAEIKTANIEDLAVQTAKINDLSVTTLKVADNAITNDAEDSFVVSNTYTTTEEVIASVTVTLNGGYVLLMGHTEIVSNEAAFPIAISAQMRIREDDINGTAIQFNDFQFPADSAGDAFAASQNTIYDAAGESGSKTFVWTIQSQASDQEGLVNNGKFIALSVFK